MQTKITIIKSETLDGVSSFQADVEREFLLFHAWRQQSETFLAVA